MHPPADPRNSEIEVRYLHRAAVVRFGIGRGTAHAVLWGLIALDLLVVLAYLLSTLPELRALTVNHRLAILDLGQPANLPGAYAVLKLLAACGLAGLMVLSAGRGEPRSAFWTFTAALFFAMALAEMARLHEVLAAGVAVKLLGDPALAARTVAIAYALVLGGFWVAAFRAWRGTSAAALVLLALAGLAFVLAQAAPRWDWPLARALFEATMAGVRARFGADAAAVAWLYGLITLAYSLLLAALVFAVRDIQAVSVRYVYHGAD